MKFEFNRQMVIEGHLQALVNELTLKVERLERSKAAYKGWKTKRMLKNVKQVKGK